MINLDMDVLRTLVCLQDLGSLQRAADRVGRSQSAASQQLRKLEDQVGRPLFRKQGRGLALTEAGEVVLAYARRILDLNDEAVVAAAGGDAEGTVRFGLPADFAETWLPAVLGLFKRAHPLARVQAGVDRTVVLLDRLDRGELDLVLAFGAGTRADSAVLGRFALVWIGKDAPAAPPQDPVALVMFEPRCLFRSHAQQALDRAGWRWRIDFTSESLAGIWAAVGAGLGLTVRTALGLPGHLAVLDGRSGLPDLPSVELCLHDGGRPLSPAALRLKAILLDTLPAHTGQRPAAAAVP